MNPLRIAVLVGSLRRESYSRKLALVLTQMARPELNLRIEPIGKLSFYNEDDDHGSPPQAWNDFRARISEAAAVLFVTPEYNRSVPAVLKNAIDVASRPYGKSAWNGKPGAVISVSPGQIGGFGANHHLRQSLVFLNVPVLQQPEAYVGGAAELFDAQGGLIKQESRQFLERFIKSYADWIALTNQAVHRQAAD